MKAIGWCKRLDECDTCQCDVLGTCKVKYSDTEEIHYSLKNRCCKCGSMYHTINNYDYCVCTNCGYTWR